MGSGRGFSSRRLQERRTPISSGFHASMGWYGAVWRRAVFHPFQVRMFRSVGEGRASSWR
ncbi:hypothetical protein [Streptomyces sp. 6N106]|uniref:hypothetical protein n=1 Tax=Streptomyces sp. 6N106 TaxID=3457418 RepID=UPI003FCEFB2F